MPPSFPGHDDTHTRLSALETNTARMEAAISAVGESTQRLAIAVEKLITYQEAHDKAVERTGKRLESIEGQVDTCQSRFNKWLYIGFGVWVVVGGLISFLGGYLVDGVITLNREIHMIDKRLELLEYKSGSLHGTAFQCEPEKENPEPIQQPKTRSALQPELRGG